MLFPLVAFLVLLLMGWFLDEFSASDVGSGLIYAFAVVIFAFLVDIPFFAVVVGFALADIVLILKIFGGDIRIR